MAEDWAGIAAEVAAAIEEVGFAATLLRAAPGWQPQKPWDTGTAADPTSTPITVIDDGVRDFFGPGGMLLRRARVLTIGATGLVPTTADRIVVRGETHDIAEVRPTAPGGVDLLYEVELVS